MRFRIGVHLGDVVEKPDGSAYADGVNIAARLQALALPGGILVSDSVYSAVRRRVNATFEDLGEQQVKNIVDPVRAYRVVVTTAAGAIGSASKPSQASRLQVTTVRSKVEQIQLVSAVEHVDLGRIDLQGA